MRISTYIALGAVACFPPLWIMQQESMEDRTTRQSMEPKGMKRTASNAPVSGRGRNIIWYTTECDGSFAAIQAAQSSLDAKGNITFVQVKAFLQAKTVEIEASDAVYNHEQGTLNVHNASITLMQNGTPMQRYGTIHAKKALCTVQTGTCTATTVTFQGLQGKGSAKEAVITKDRNIIVKGPLEVTLSQRIPPHA